MGVGTKAISLSKSSLRTTGMCPRLGARISLDGNCLASSIFGPSYLDLQDLQFEALGSLLCEYQNPRSAPRAEADVRSRAESAQTL